MDNFVDKFVDKFVDNFKDNFRDNSCTIVLDNFRAVSVTINNNLSAMFIPDNTEYLKVSLFRGQFQG